MSVYYPEMGEARPDRLIHSRHNFRDTYSVSWPVDRDTEAREQMRKLRVRPVCGGIKRHEPGEWSTATALGKPVYHCLVSSGSHRKLLDADLVALEALLD